MHYSLFTIHLTEPRDEELRQLSWLQQQVALLVEARDALAPQLQALVKRIGNFSSSTIVSLVVLVSGTSAVGMR